MDEGLDGSKDINYGFLIDNRKCIGCHACSVACKSENEVPLGVNRTWVKYVEKGAFPDVRRSFQVTRCNHCANPPCVRICPVTAMYQRTDGIVEFDPRICIGCKACMQACPYDAIYIDPESNTAAKCHFCSHRVEVGLEPACVVVCPEHAIIAGDMNDPASEISRLLSREQVSVRKPEQGTAPKLFYIDADEVTLTPTAAQYGASFLWADLITEQQIPVLHSGRGNNGNGYRPQSAPVATAFSGTPIRTPGNQGLGSKNGPIVIGEGRMAEHMVQTVYNAQHKVPWHWPVPAYLVTKAIGSGAFALLALFFGLGFTAFSRPVALVGGLISLLFIGVTTLLLVLDLEKPGRFFSILTRPQWRSWLTRGAFILVGFSAVAGLWVLVEAGVQFNLLPASLVETLRPVFLWPGLALAVLAAIYTAFLFGQAEGRDLWQSSLLPFHLALQAVIAGSATLLAAGQLVALPEGMQSALAWTLGCSLVLDLFVTLFGELGMPHASELAARAAHELYAGKYRWHFWGGSILLGHALPLAALVVGILGGVLPEVMIFLAAPSVIAGLFLYEYAYVMAPQEIPNS
jgi:Fe-S-cluster-containing dehydrogenase component/formate-dependent nitrite reductase membrane component NrfD